MDREDLDAKYVRVPTLWRSVPPPCPYSGAGLDMDREDLDAKYVRVLPEDVEEEWTRAYDAALEHCVHGPECRQGPGCTVGGGWEGVRARGACERREGGAATVQ